MYTVISSWYVTRYSDSSREFHRHPFNILAKRKNIFGTERRSLQKVQGHRAGVDVDVTPSTGGPVGHPPNPAALCDRSAQGSKS